MPSIMEPIAAGIFVSLINKYIIQNNFFIGYCKCPNEEEVESDDHHDNASSSNTSIMSDLTVNHVAVHF